MTIVRSPLPPLEFFPARVFPIRVIYFDTKQETLVKAPQDIRRGVEFLVTEVNVKESK